jgi:hypothetical protein
MKQQPGAVLINTDPVMKQFITAHDYIFYGDTHPKARVHAEYARVIFERLMRVMSFRRKQPSPSSDTVHRQQR